MLSSTSSFKYSTSSTSFLIVTLISVSCCLSSSLKPELNSFRFVDQEFTIRGAKQHVRECEMVIKIFVMHYCTVMLSSSCANCSAQSVSNYSMPSARPSIQPETMLVSKKKVNACNLSRDFKIGLGHVMNSLHVKIF